MFESDGCASCHASIGAVGDVSHLLLTAVSDNLSKMVMGMKNMMAAASWAKGMLSMSESRAFCIFISPFTQILALLSSILHTAVSSFLLHVYVYACQRCVALSC